MTSADAATVRGVTSEAPAELAGMPPSPAVWCSGLRKRYGRQTAVDDVSFTVARGEVLGLLGPNGAGKTSVIKMLLGLVRPDAGEVMLLGRRSSDPRSRSAVGYLPELFRYQPWLTATEVLALHVRLSRVDVPAAEQQDCLALVGLADRAGDRVGGFSKGMQQRLGLAVALVARPELVVLDEPTSALDPLGRATRATASPSRCCMPFENPPTRSPVRSARPTRARHSRCSAAPTSTRASRTCRARTSAAVSHGW